MPSDERINLLAKVARTPHGTYAGTTGERSILTIAAASYGSKPTDEATVPTGFDPFAAALFESIVEAAYLVATADGIFDEEELRTFERIVTASCGGMVPQRLVADLVADLSDQLQEDGLEQRIKRLAEGVTKREQATEVLRIAALVASASDDVSAIEREVLERIASAFKVDSAPAAVDSALEDVKKSLTA